MSFDVLTQVLPRRKLITSRYCFQSRRGIEFCSRSVKLVSRIRIGGICYPLSSSVSINTLKGAASSKAIDLGMPSAAKPGMKGTLIMAATRRGQCNNSWPMCQIEGLALPYGVFCAVVR